MRRYDNPVSQALTALALLVFLVSVVGGAIAWYANQTWGNVGVLVTLALFIGIPMFLLVGTMMSVFLLVSQRIWANVSSDQVSMMSGMFRLFNSQIGLQKQRERYSPLPQGPVDDDPPLLPDMHEWGMPESRWDVADIPALGDELEIER